MAVATTTLSLDDELRRIFSGETEAIQDPYPVYRRLREESPVHRYDAQTVIVSSHREAKACYRDDTHFPTTPVLGNRFVDQLRLLGPEELAMMDEFAAFEKNTISRKNGADHIRVRRAAHRYFTPRRAAAYEPLFQRIFDELLEERSDLESFDFMSVAYRLPLLVICEILGIPRGDAEQVKAWGDEWLINMNPIPRQAVRRKRVVMDEYSAYVRGLIARHRCDGGRSSLIASVLDAADDDRLSEDELIGFFLHTSLAGHETTQHMIGNGLRALLLHQDEWRLLCDDQDRVPAAIEEVVRWDPPVPYISKFSAAGAMAGGVSIPPAINVLLLQAAANRDPAVFRDPDRFDVTRHPNDHLSFGFGTHFCLGASLARLEGRIVFGTLARRHPEIELAIDPAELCYHAGIRGLRELPVRLGRRHTAD